MRLLICGDRHWTNKQLIAQELLKVAPDTVIIAGAAQGADTIAAREARQLGLIVHEFPAKWSEYGRAAGPIRNLEMLQFLKASEGDEVWAFHDDLEHSKGTKHMVNAAHKARIPVTIFTSHSKPRHLAPASARETGLPL